MEEYISEEINLLVGQSKKIKLGFVNSFNIVYCGMPNKDVFSLSLMLSSGYQGYGFNLYFPKDLKIVRIHDKEFRLINVNPDMITLRIEKLTS